MIQNIINRYKRARTNAWLSQNYDSQFAFIGMGQHSLNNLYPVLDYLHIPLKYVCVTSEDKAKLISRKFRWTEGITSVDDILKDDSIKGVFVSVTPSAHFEIAKKVLSSGKSLFIEKPPCSSLDELNELIAISSRHPESVVTVGLQKRFAPATQILRKRLKSEDIISYNLRYLTGAYPEGNALLDLFIHPLDMISHLFGEADIVACEKLFTNSYMLILKHRHIIGCLELSTNHTWTNAKEELSVYTKSGIYDLRQTENLTFTPRQGSICGIPLEKVWRKTPTIEVLYNHNPFSPTLSNNSIYTQGFYNEINTFIDAIEGKRHINLSSLQSLRNTYKLIDKIKKQRKP